MIRLPKLTPAVRAVCGIGGGLALIYNAIAGYGYMHSEFFGMPHFTLSTPRGRNEIMYALSSLMVAACGAGFSYVGIKMGVKARRENP